MNPYRVMQKSKSRWIVLRGGEQVSIHASEADARRCAEKYAAGRAASAADEAGATQRAFRASQRGTRFERLVRR